MANNYFRSDGWVKLVTGQAVPGAQIYVLTQPANVVPPITPPRTTPVPFIPNPQALIYSDDGLTPIVQPIITDGFGHYDFYTLPGLYTLAVYFNGQLQNFYIDQSVGNVGSSSGPSITFLTNGTPNFNQFVQNLVQGAGIVLFTDNLGNTTITNTTVTPPPSLPEPETARFALWQANVNPSITPTSDTVAISDSGANAVFFNPTASSGAYFMVTAGYGGGINVVDREYSGQNFIYPARNTNIYGTAEVNNSGLTDQISFWGISDALSGNSPVGYDSIGLYAQCVGGVWRNFQLYTGVNGGSSTMTDSGIPMVNL